MNIITTIQTALDALNSDADLFLLSRSRAENQELEHEKDVIVVYPDWRDTNQLTPAMTILKTRIYNIDFKTPDQWDNSDDDESLSYDSETSAEKIESMDILADSLFAYITANNDQFQEIQEKLSWRTLSPLLRVNNGTMSGVSIQLTVVFARNRTCNFSNS